MTDPVLERARAGDPGAFIDLVRPHHDRLSAGAADERALLVAYVEAYRALPGYRGQPLEEWLAGFIATGDGAVAGPEFWPRLAAALNAEAPALAEPELPERRFPVIPRMPGAGRPRRR